MDTVRKQFWLKARVMLSFICSVLMIASVEAESKPLVVGMEMNFPPFEMLGTDGKPAGISVDLAEALGKSLGRPVRLENIPFEGLIPSLRTGKIDIIISSMTKTSERAQAIDFSDPYLKMGLALLVNKASKIHSIQDVDQPQIKVAVKKGTTGHIYAETHLTHAKILVFDQDATCATEVSQGKADCMIYDQLSVFKYWKHYPDTTRGLLQAFKLEEWAIGLPLGSDELKKQINNFLVQFKKTGGFDTLGNKYLGDNKAAFEKAGIPFYF
jgi:polar amino acid transport system substrate-binding protein